MTPRAHDPQSDEELLDAAEAAFEEGRDADAVASLSAMQEDNVLRWLFLAQVVSAAGDTQGVAAALARAEELVGADDPQLCMVRGQTALACWKLDQVHAALDALERAPIRDVCRRSVETRLLVVPEHEADRALGFDCGVREDARRLEHERRSGRIVVGAGREAGTIPHESATLTNFERSVARSGRPALDLCRAPRSTSSTA